MKYVTALLVGLLILCLPLRGEALTESVRIDSLLSKAFAPGEPGIAVIAVERGNTVFRKGYGIANLELGVPIQPEAVFRIGSVTKTFTAMAVMILVERGMVSLDSEISQYLPDYPTQGEKITVRRLLTHTAGIRDLFRTDEYNQLMREDCFRLINDEVELSELVNTFKDYELEFVPGEQYRYSNSGYFLLGRIIEVVSGKSYAEFLKENIFDPLGMRDTHFYDNINIIPNRALDYLQDDGRFINNPYESLSGILVHAAGGLMSAVDDIARFDAGLYANKLVTRATLESMYAPGVLNSGDTIQYGLGWELRQMKGHRIVMHGGDVYGYSAIMLRVPESRILVAILGNDERVHSIYLEYFAKKIAAILLGDPFPDWQTITLSPDQLAKYVGSYKIKDGDVRKVIIEGSRIYTQRNDRPRLETFPTADGVFFYDRLLNYMTFDEDETGRVFRMVMHYDNGKDVEALRE